MDGVGGSRGAGDRCSGWFHEQLQRMPSGKNFTVCPTGRQPLSYRDGEIVRPFQGAKRLPR